MWRIIYDKAVTRQLEKLSLAVQAEIREGLQNQRWKHLQRRTGGSWFAIPSIMPVQIGDFRVLCKTSSVEDAVDVVEISYDPRPDWQP